MPKTLCFGEGVLVSCISHIIHPIKLIREKYLNCSKKYNLKNLVLIAEDENKIRINSGVSNVYRFSHMDFEGVEFYAPRQYVRLKKEIIEEELFVSDEEE